MLDFRKGFHFKDLLSFQERLYKKYLTSTNGIEHKRAVENLRREVTKVKHIGRFALSKTNHPCRDQIGNCHFHQDSGKLMHCVLSSTVYCNIISE